MIRSQEIALRCAATLPKHLLVHKWSDERQIAHETQYGLRHRKPSRMALGLMDQLDRCQSDEARRLLLGRSR